MLTRRDIVAGLFAMPCALEALAAPAPDAAAGGSVMGPAVFLWQNMKPVKTATGEVRSVCKAPTATLDQLEIHVTTLNPGEMPHQPHRHVNEELIIMRDGECETLSDGKWIRVGPGSIVFNASNSLHGFRNVGSVPAVYHVINWSPGKCGGTKSR
jgi:quercetin dioxygenase-like cupin family protein